MFAVLAGLLCWTPPVAAQTKIRAEGVAAVSNNRVDIAREKALPFEPLVPNATTLAAMKEARQGGLKSFANVQALMADLNADD